MIYIEKKNKNIINIMITTCMFCVTSDESLVTWKE